MSQERKVKEVEKPRDYLAEARKKVDKWQKETKSHKFDFDSCLTESIERNRQQTRDAQEHLRAVNTYYNVELNALRHHLGASGNGIVGRGEVKWVKG